MKKFGRQIAAAALALLFVLVLSVPALAAEEPHYYVFDEAGLFTTGERDSIYEKAKRMSELLGVDIIVTTTDIDHGYTALGYAEAMFDEMEYGTGAQRNGMVFYIDMYNRELTIFSNGAPYRWLQGKSQKVTDSGYSAAKNGDYAKAMGTMMDQALDYALAGNGYAGLSFGERVRYKFSLELLGISLGVGAVAAAIVVGILLAVHYSGKPKTPHAGMYIAEGGMRTTHARDYFIHTHTTRTAIPKDNGSSGGSSGGGGGGSRGGASTRF